MPATLGKLETQTFAYIQMRGTPTIRSEEVTSGLRITAVQTPIFSVVWRVDT